MIPLIIALAGGGAVFLIFIALLDDVESRVMAKLTSLHQVAERDLRAASRSDVSATRMVQLTLIGSAGGFIVGVLLTRSLFVGVALAAIGYIAPTRWLRHQRRVRLDRLEAALPGALDQIVSSVRAGLSLTQAIDEASKHTHGPIGEEMAQITADTRLGARLPEAIASAQRRIGGRAFPLVATALLTSIEKGGNLPEALQRIADALKEIWRLEQKLITSSAEARKASRVISAMPVVIAVMVMLVQPDLARSMTSSVLGIILLCIIGGIYLAGLAWLKRMLVPDV